MTGFQFGRKLGDWGKEDDPSEKEQVPPRPAYVNNIQVSNMPFYNDLCHHESPKTWNGSNFGISKQNSTAPLCTSSRGT